MYLNGPDLPIGQDSFAAFWFHIDYYECNGPTTVASSTGVFHLPEWPFTLLKIDEQCRNKLIPIESMGRGTVAVRTKLCYREIRGHPQIRTEFPFRTELVQKKYLPIIVETFEETAKSDYALLGIISASIMTSYTKSNKALKGGLYPVRVHALEMLQLDQSKPNFGQWGPVNEEIRDNSTDMSGRPLLMADIEILSTKSVL